MLWQPCIHFPTWQPEWSWGLLCHWVCPGPPDASAPHLAHPTPLPHHGLASGLGWPEAPHKAAAVSRYRNVLSSY